MSSLCCRRRSPAGKTPLEDDDLLSEILLRLPPQPSSLPRASLVCRRWHIASDRGFFRRFRRHHRHNPPLLGLFNKEDWGLSFMPTLEAPNRVPPGRFSLHPGDGDRYMSLGCRHGLVLVFNTTRSQMLVWEPVTGEQHLLAIPPGIATYAEKTAINGAVRRVGDTHFQVVLTVADNDDKQHRRALACVYLSETGLWGDLISTPLPYLSETGLWGDLISSLLQYQVPVSHSVEMSDNPTLVYKGRPAVLAGDSLYWILVGNFAGILEFDLEKQSLAVIRVPVHMLEEGRYQFRIMRAEGGGLGLLFQLDCRFQLWKRNADSDGVASWGLERTIDLDNLLSLNLLSPTILGFAEENNAVFLWTHGAVFMVNLESLQFKKLFETNYLPHCHPFESLYPARHW
ncbi:unnamed protein product [Alopecurus aequalis]